MRVQPAFNFTVMILALALVGLATSTQANAGRYSRRGAHRSMASVTTARQGTHSTPPQLGLAIRSVSANGRMAFRR